ncbi:MAG TPA: sulfurtransferase [Symbiobacteriaceae bacterium]|nr:sulfurtransferase [Symbiobacteriaceae bacterium]
MREFPRPLISVEQVAGLLGRDDVVIVDCRFTLGNPDAGRRAYNVSHIPGAVYFHLDEDLSGPTGEHGGRHPLPDPAVFAAKLGAAGIGPGVKVVAYDSAGPFAGRLWWLLRWLGHDDVTVLDGGWNAWEEAGMAETADLPSPCPRVFEPRPRPEMVASMADVRRRPESVAVIDARSPQRFAGQPDPLDAKPGHVPGAVNCFWQESLRPDGFFKSPEEQAARFAGLPPAIIQMCGSGVTACANLLGMAIAGLDHGLLYVGGWSDWCTYPDNAVEK